MVFYLINNSNDSVVAGDFSLVMMSLLLLNIGVVASFVKALVLTGGGTIL